MNKLKGIIFALFTVIGLEIGYIIFYNVSGKQLIFLILSIVGCALCALAVNLEMKKKNKDINTKEE